MLFQVIKGLLRSSPRVRRAITRLSYEAMSRWYRGEDLPFLNFGYLAPEGDGRTLDLLPAEEPARVFLQLYHRIAPPVVLAGREVLEVGCGRGGGAAWLARVGAPARLVGLDAAPSAIRFARRRHEAQRNLQFVSGDAERLPFPAASFDVVVNVESSHCSGSVPRFLEEVARVLRPGGVLCFGDVRDTPQAAALVQLFRHPPAGLVLVEEEDLTAGVRRALEETSPRKEEVLARFPRLLQGVLRDQTGIRGGVVHQAFVRGERVYWRALLRKFGPGEPARSERSP